MKSRDLILLLLIGFLGAFIRLHGLKTAEMGADAVISIESAKQPDLHSALNHIRQKHQGAAPLDFVILHYWIKFFGDSNLIVQLPSVIWALLSLVLVYQLSRKIFNTKTAIYALLLMSISPLHVYFSQEARYYSLLIFATLLCVFSFCKFLEKPNLKYSIILFGSLAMGLYSHYYILLLIFIFGLWLLYKTFIDKTFKIHVLIKFVITSALSTLLFMPWFFFKAAKEYAYGTRFTYTESLNVALCSLVQFTGTHFINYKIDYVPFILGALFFAGGVLYILKNKNLSNLILFIISFLFISIYIICLKYQYYPTTRQWINILPFFIIVQAGGMAAFFSWLKKRAIHWGSNLFKILHILVLFLLLWGPAKQLYDYKRGPTTFISLMEMSKKSLTNKDTLVGIGLSSSDAAERLLYANTRLNVVKDVLYVSKWLESYSSEAKHENKFKKIVFVSSDKAAAAKGNVHFQPPWYYYFPEATDESDEEQLMRFIDLQKGILKNLENKNINPRLFPSDIMLKISQAYLYLGDTQEAINLLEKAIQYNPLRRDAHAEYAAILEMLGQMDKAEQQWRAAVKAVPPNSEDRFRLAKILKEKNQINEAEQLLRDAIKLKQDHQWAIALLRQILIDTNRMDEANKWKKYLLSLPEISDEINLTIKFQDSDDDLMRYIRKKGEEGTLVITVGFLDDDIFIRDAMLGSGNKEQNIRLGAIRDIAAIAKSASPFGKEHQVLFVSSEKLDESTTFTVELCGSLWVASADYLYSDWQTVIKDGLVFKTKFHEIHKKNVNENKIAWDSVLIADLISQLPDGDKIAEPWYKNAAELSPDVAYLAFLYARNLLNNNKPDDALNQISRIELLESKRADTEYIKAEALALKGDYEGAVNSFKQIMELNQNHEKAIQRCAEIFDSIQRSDEALFYWKRLFDVTKNKSVKQKAFEKIIKKEAAKPAAP